MPRGGLNRHSIAAQPSVISWPAHGTNLRNRVYSAGAIAAAMPTRLDPRPSSRRAAGPGATGRPPLARPRKEGRAGWPRVPKATTPCRPPPPRSSERCRVCLRELRSEQSHPRYRRGPPPGSPARAVSTIQDENQSGRPARWRQQVDLGGCRKRSRPHATPQCALRRPSRSRQ
jgi:hypothetical protein